MNNYSRSFHVSQSQIPSWDFKLLLVPLALCLSFYLWSAPARADVVSSAIPSSGPSAREIRERILARVQRAPEHRKVAQAFDIPIVYNHRVSHWIEHFQGRGRNWFSEWLERSSRYLPFLQAELSRNGLPQDLAYMVMIESGFNHNAESSAAAVGPWQFIAPTAERYGLEVSWWLDERRDLSKATTAAIRYLKDLHAEFKDWHLAAAAYNMGENGLRRLIRRHQSRSFWELARISALPRETREYVPKILAAMIISKSPGLYGFVDYAKLQKFDFDTAMVPGGTEIEQMAKHLGVTTKYLRDLNAELLLGYVPAHIAKHPLRIPKGSAKTVAAALATSRVQQRPSQVESPRVVGALDRKPAEVTNAATVNSLPSGEREAAEFLVR